MSSGLARRALIGPIRAYQLVLSPLLGPRCRFYPSCSTYAIEGLSRHGVWWGLYLATRRLLRCHPWNPGGLDPVPSARPRFRVRSAPRTTSSSGAGL